MCTVLTYDVSDLDFAVFFTKRTGAMIWGKYCESNAYKYFADYSLTYEDFVNDPTVQHANGLAGGHKYTIRELESLWLWVTVTRDTLQTKWEEYKKCSSA